MSGKTAMTKRYPALLPFVLEAKRFFNFLWYSLKPAFKLARTNAKRWPNLAKHSSPLYRKFNKRVLDEGKVENIKIAIKAMDGLVIPPGKIFSFWKFVGRPSRKNGFKNGLILSDGRLGEGIGGGLCQLSNLIAYMFGRTECEFVERKHHSRDVFPDSGRIIPFASGATVFFNLIDLKIKNVYPFPVKINLRLSETQLRGSISSPVSLDYFVKLEEKRSCFIKSSKTQIVYRCNELRRVFYSKKTKQKIKESVLWLNTARVMYGEKDIKGPIMAFDSLVADLTAKAQTDTLSCPDFAGV